MKLSQIAQILKSTYAGEEIEVHGVSIDSRTIQPGQLFVALRGENFDGHDFIDAAQKAGALAAVVSEEGHYSLPIIKVKDTHKALIELASFNRQQFHIPVIAITGSCGKTTTRALTAAILSQAGKTLASQASYNNNIGIPLTMLRLKQDDQFMVQEMGANHPGEIAALTHMLKPTVAVITCAAPVHLEGFGDLDGVACAKGEIYQGLNSDGTAIINNDDHYTDFWHKRAGNHRIVSFGINNDADVSARNIELNHLSQPRFDLVVRHQVIEVQLQLIGEHNVYNALAAAAVAFACDVPLALIKRGLEMAESEKMRLQTKRGIKGSQVIDDSYNANPAAMLAAAKILARHLSPKVMVIGDMGELGDEAEHYHQELGKELQQHQIDELYCYGPLTKFTANTFGKKAHHFDKKEELIHSLLENLASGSTVLIKGSRSMGMEQVTKALMEE